MCVTPFVQISHNKKESHRISDKLAKSFIFLYVANKEVEIKLKNKSICKHSK
jgi:hypothetical protein